MIIFLEVRAIEFNTATGARPTFGSVRSNILNVDQTFDAADDGELKITGLANGTNYNFSVAFIDKYQLMPRLSTSREVTPLSIEELLKKEACFLITSGFEREHFVLDYFKMIRDEVLLKFSLGQMFTSWYYEAAPKWTGFILDRPWLKALIRACAYTFYYLTKYLWVLVSIFTFLYLSRRVYCLKKLAN